MADGERATATLGDRDRSTSRSTDNDDTPKISVMAGDPADEGTFMTFTVSMSGASSGR